MCFKESTCVIVQRKKYNNKNNLYEAVMINTTTIHILIVKRMPRTKHKY